jgi:hypothetical protein
MRRRERSAASRSTEAREASSPRAPIARAETTTPRGAREEAVAARPRGARETSRAPATRVGILEAAAAAPEVVIAIVGDIDDRARVLSESPRLALAEPPPREDLPVPRCAFWQAEPSKHRARRRKRRFVDQAARSKTP